MELFATASQHEEIKSKPIVDAFNKRVPLSAPCSGERSVGTFSELGLCRWVCDSAAAMGLKRPTPIQQSCIPAILSQRDVLACAETGSGKTAAFALPILQLLSEDPFGIYCLVLTPTRELAIQINEQFVVLGASFGVRTCLVLGGVGMTEQSLALEKLPHIVVATPGRMRHHLESASPPNLSRTRFLVLDEADRLMCSGFAEELHVVLTNLSHPRRRTLLFSATLSSSMQQLQDLALDEHALLFDLTAKHKIPEQLQQHYVFVPSRVKTCYLVAMLLKLIEKDNASHDDSNQHVSGIGGTSSRQQRDQVNEILANELNKGSALKSGGSNKKRKSISALRRKQKDETLRQLKSYSLIIFVSTCNRCQQTAALLRQMNIDCVALHSVLSQAERVQALGKFKSRYARVLVATDVASRGLDIPAVDLVINFDLPKQCEDYVHRVGRTARAGKGGRSISMVTQFEVSLLQAIEAGTGGHKMEVAQEFQDFLRDPDHPNSKEFVQLLNPVSKAMRLASMEMGETGFTEKIEVVKKRKRQQKRQILRKFVRLGGTPAELGQQS